MPVKIGRIGVRASNLVCLTAAEVHVAPQQKLSLKSRVGKSHVGQIDRLCEWSDHSTRSLPANHRWMTSAI
jgi:hypothetical protein